MRTDPSESSVPPKHMATLLRVSRDTSVKQKDNASLSELLCSSGKLLLKGLLWALRANWV